jgi:mRNA interferase MazF
VARPYIPDRGDIVWLNFSPHAGHEQAGNRPALVLSPRDYNDKVGLAVFCPITSRVKDFPFEVLLPEGFRIAGVVLADQVKSLDWRSRQVEFVVAAPAAVVDDVVAKILSLMSNDG